jgi:hypothetical protein
LNNVVTVLIFVYFALRHYRNYRIELEHFVTKQEIEQMCTQQTEILNLISEAAIIVTDPARTKIPKKDKYGQNTDKITIRSMQPKLLFCNSATAFLAAEPLDKMDPY